MLNENDHRVIAAKMGLLHFQEEAPGMVFWHPRGFTLSRLLEEEARRHVTAGGYREVRGPQRKDARPKARSRISRRRFPAPAT